MPSQRYDPKSNNRPYTWIWADETAGTELEKLPNAESSRSFLPSLALRLRGCSAPISLNLAES